MTRGPLHYIIIYTYSLLSLDRGWGPQSVSASACAHEDRHVGGTRWADASDIHSDSITCLSPCYLGSWVSGRAGLLYARGAESRIFEITIPHAARESTHVVVSRTPPTINSFPPSHRLLTCWFGYLHLAGDRLGRTRKRVIPPIARLTRLTAPAIQSSM